LIAIDNAFDFRATKPTRCSGHCTQLLAEAAGSTKPIPHKIASLTAGQVGTQKGGHFISFQPLWDSITAAEPDLFN
jgi:hypothetical protein